MTHPNSNSSSSMAITSLKVDLASYGTIPNHRNLSISRDMIPERRKIKLNIHVEQYSSKITCYINSALAETGFHQNNVDG